MEYRTLGRTGVEVSTHCLGALMFGPWGNTDQIECVRMIHQALDAGVNFVDTADVYGEGRSEEIVGQALEGRRDDVFLATKVHGRLRTDHIDLYQIHRPEPNTDIDETLGALTDLVRQGKVRYLGCSTFPAFQIVEAHWASEGRGLERFNCEQPPYSIFVRHNELDVLPVCRQYGMGVIVWSPLAGGWLAGKYRRGQGVPEDSRAKRYADRGSPIVRRYDPTNPENDRKLDLVDDLTNLADKAGISLTHLAIAFTLAHPVVTSAIIGPRTPGQLEDLLAGADVRLDGEILDAIDELVAPGTTLNEADRGWEPPWMAPEARRR